MENNLNPNVDHKKVKDLFGNRIIPSIKGMIEKEEKHLDFLKENKVSSEMIKQSKIMLESYKDSLTEYEKYLEQVSKLKD